jgi:hypothetical protein
MSFDYGFWVSFTLKEERDVLFLERAISTSEPTIL